MPFTKRGKYGRGGFFIVRKSCSTTTTIRINMAIRRVNMAKSLNLRVSDMNGDYGEAEVTVPATGQTYKLPSGKQNAICY